MAIDASWPGASAKTSRPIHHLEAWAAALLSGAFAALPLDWASAVGGAISRLIGPHLGISDRARRNIRCALPELSEGEIAGLIRAMWDNLGRVAAEYAHLDRLWDFDSARPSSGRILVSPDSIERFVRLRDVEPPTLVFTAHLANWELPALAAAAYGVRTAILYRTPNIGDVAAAVRGMRAPRMGTLISTGIGAPSAVAAALERGLHVGMLVDQYFHRGVDVLFFGRRTKANPMIARIARHFDCPIRGTRAIRLEDHRFRMELTEPIAPPRDHEGRIDVEATTQMIATIIEGWVREHPGQWLWLHRRWR